MKKNLLMGLVLTSVTGSLMAQLPVSTTPQNKKAVLEEFTGIHCGYCPDGHVIANNIYNADPNNVILINIHSGGFANAANGEQDLKTADGNAIDAMSGMGITGYPAGTMNRTVLSGSVMAGGRGLWTNWANTIKTQSAYVNVACQGTINVQTRVLTVDVEVYYTANSPVATNSLSVFLLENKIPGIQDNYGNPLWNASNYNPDGTYNHSHVLRKALTPTFGMSIPNTTSGSTFTTQLTYTIPATYGAINKTTPCLLGNLELVAFVTQTDRITINGARGPLTLSNFANTNDIATTNLKSDLNVCSGTNFGSSIKFTNLGSSTVTSAVFSYAMNGGTANTYSWTGSVAPMAQALTINLPGINFTPSATNTLVVDVVSVNGVTDQNASNNVVTKTVPDAPLANSANMQMDFTQDRYGAECTWNVKDEITNATIISGGPYANLSANGTLLHTHTFVVSNNTCYKLSVFDSYGDGINSGAGAGNYSLKSGGVTVISSNGQYGSGEVRLFKSTTVTSITNTDVENMNSVRVYPNPTAAKANLSIDLRQNEKLTITVINSLGQVVYSEQAVEYAAGENMITFDTEKWSNGVYFINVSSDKGSVKQKLTVSK
jgi:hypothetical protein